MRGPINGTHLLALHGDDDPLPVLSDRVFSLFRSLPQASPISLAGLPPIFDALVVFFQIAPGGNENSLTSVFQLPSTYLGPILQGLRLCTRDWLSQYNGRLTSSKHQSKNPLPPPYRPCCRCRRTH